MRDLNTPQTFWASLYVIWALDVLLLIAAIAGARVHRNAMKVVGKDTAPSIIHAQHIKTALADMDANLANELLGEPGEMEHEAKAYERRRAEAATALIEAAKNITFDEAEQKPIEAIQVGMGTYEAEVQRARDQHDRGDPAYVVVAYRRAASVLDSVLLPEADELDKVNFQELKKTYEEQSDWSMTTIIFMLLMGASLVGALVTLQKYLNQKTRRILNPMLILATLVTLGFVLYTFDVLGSERHHLKVAKEDAFDSIHALWRARAVAYAANADESRYLLDGAHAREHEVDFRNKTAMLATPPIPSIAHVEEVLGHGGKLSDFKGYLADELNNITFENESDAAIAALSRFGDYMDVDEQLRSLQRSGKHDQAVELCIGRNRGQSNWAFDQLDLAIGKTIEINQSHFDMAVAAGFAALSNFEVKASSLAVIIALLTFFGLLKRIQEYQ